MAANVIYMIIIIIININIVMNNSFFLSLQITGTLGLNNAQVPPKLLRYCVQSSPS